ncbi:MAG: hypothetical protein MAGBODY4_00420 [Candidatus Marinimicrobia bacterium]|nr:hypothetical protein [Candidatus Neomarinimicrobiota bacterium]
MNQRKSRNNKPESPERDQTNSLLETYQKLEPYLGLGLTFTVTILAFLFFGRWLDSRFGTSPWLLITGAAVGMILGFIHLYYTVIQLNQSDSQTKDKDAE